MRSLNPIHNAQNLTDPKGAWKESVGGLKPDPIAAPPLPQAQQTADTNGLTRQRKIAAQRAGVSSLLTGPSLASTGGVSLLGG